MTIRTYQYQVQVLVTQSGGTEYSRTVAHEDILTDSATASTDMLRSVSHTDIVTDETFVGQTVVVLDELALEDTAAHFVLLGGTIPVLDELGLVETVKVFGYEDVVDDLGLTDAASATFPQSFNREHSLELLSEATFSYGIRNFTVEQELGIVDGVSITVPLSITQLLGLTDLADRFQYRVTQELGITDEAEWGYGKSIVQPLGLIQTADKIQDLNKTVSHTSVVTQSVAWFIESPCHKLQFKSYHGEGGVEPTSAKLNYYSRFLFQSLDDGSIVQLRNPETDDRRRYSFNRTNRRFFDNSLDLYADDSWVTEQTQLYTIVSVKQQDLDSMVVFLEANLGRQVLLKDWRGVTWLVVIVNVGEVYTEDSEGHWTLDFEVTGRAWDGEYVIQKVVLTDEVSRAGSIYNRTASDTDILVDAVGRNYDSLPSQDMALLDNAVFTIE